ncbi:MAG: LysM peptidoglycan-binding domain-containing protein, partial [Sphingobacteriales bacterium]
MENVRKWFYASAMFMLLAFSAEAQSKKITAEEYIASYKDIAIAEMKRTGIPASITLSQGLLESGNGNSELAKQSNNHFGIKCKKEWTGRTVNYDDDAPQECFRAYDKPEDSYLDHSNFLVNSPRYAALFELEATDYKGWAKGLKDAGYATNPKYPELLISAIEKYSLFQYDLGNKRVPKEEKQDNIFVKEDKKIHNDIRKFNEIPVYVVKNGDSYQTISEQYKMMRWQISKYNDLEKNEKLQPGTILYLKPKKRKAEKEFHTVQEGESMYYISQMYAIKLKQLYKKNHMEEGQEAAIGETLYLRKKRTDAPKLRTDKTYVSSGKRGIMADQPKQTEKQKTQEQKNTAVVKEDNTQKTVTKTEEKPVVKNQPVKPLETQKQPLEKQPVLYANEEKNSLPVIEEHNAAAEFHTVKDGDNLEKIAAKYNVEEKDIQLWNEMTDESLYPGQLLRVKGLKSSVTNKLVEKQMPDGNKVIVVEKQPEIIIQENSNEVTETAPENTDNEFYTVQTGETLYAISRKLNIPINKIHEMNNLEDNTVKAGQKLRIKPTNQKSVTEEKKQIETPNA